MCDAHMLTSHSGAHANAHICHRSGFTDAISTFVSITAVCRCDFVLSSDAPPNYRSFTDPSPTEPDELYSFFLRAILSIRLYH